MVRLPVADLLLDRRAVAKLALENLADERGKLPVAREAQPDELSDGELRDAKARSFGRTLSRRRRISRRMTRFWTLNTKIRMEMPSPRSAKAIATAHAEAKEKAT